MNKGLKKLLLICLVMIMAMGSLAACSGDKAKDDNATGNDANKEGSFKIAYDLLGSDWILQYMSGRAQWAVEHSGDNSFEYYSADFTADKMQSGTQSVLSKGIDGLIYYDAYPTLTPTIIEMCEKARVAFVLHDTPPTEEEQPLLFASKYFVGFVASSSYDNGYQLGEQAAKDGYKKALIIGGHVGDPAHDLRAAGWTAAFEKAGGKVLDQARCVSPAEAMQKSGDMLTANPDADVMFCMTGAYASGTLSSLEKQKREMMIYSIDLDADLLKYVKAGTMKGNGGAVVATMLSAALLQNWLDGHPVLDDAGKVPWITDIVNLYVDKDNADDFEKYTIKNEPLTEAVYQKFIWRYNKSVSYQDFLDFAKAYNMDYLKQINS